MISFYFIFLSTGYDTPEAVTDGLNDVLSLSWRTTATKICVFVSDAPPHGLGTHGDKFPRGDVYLSQVHSVITTVAMRSLGIMYEGTSLDPCTYLRSHDVYHI